MTSVAFCQLSGAGEPFLESYRAELPYFQELITGGQFSEPSRLIQGDPYRFSRQFESGQLRINGISYPDVPLLYDIYRDQVVTFHPIFNQKILIKPDKIESFALANGEQFRYISGNESYIHHGNGIYKVVHEGPVLALAKTYKTTKEIRDLSQFDALYVEKADYFLLKEGIFHSISRPRDAFLTLGVQPKEIKKKLKGEKLNFRQQPERYLKRFLELHSDF